MKLNEHEALLTSTLLLVPYSEHHVPTYHEWMQDPDLQALTASEPLTLPDEYAMQKSWRTDADKLTFIVCASDPSLGKLLAGLVEVPCIKAKEHDTPSSMIGDVNLFLTSDDDDDHEADEEGPDGVDGIEGVKGGGKTEVRLVGEIEIMIASPSHRGNGLGKQVLGVFIWYILACLPTILSEYSSAQPSPTTARLSYLRVKINKDNARSIRLFESIGFKRTSEDANYFGELELRWAVDAGSLGEVVDSLAGNVPLRVGYAF